MANSGEGLTSRQQRAIAAMLTARNEREAAKLAGVGYRTLNRWLTQDVFRSALRQAESDLLSAAGRLLLVNLEPSIGRLVSIRDGGKKDADQRLAARDLTEFALRWRELVSFEERLAALEEFFLHAEKGDYSGGVRRSSHAKK